MRYLDELILKDGSKVKFYKAEPDDSPVVADIYYKVYGSGYTLPEVIDRRRNLEVLENSDNLWLVASYAGRYIATVLTLVDRSYGIAKLMAGAVLPEYRRRGVFKNMIEISLRYAEERVDVIYGITRTRDVGPQKTLKYFGFKALGAFPNVRKLRTYETHVLYGKYFRDALQRRIHPEKMIRYVRKFYYIVADELDLPVNVKEYDPPVPIEFELPQEDVQVSYGELVRDSYLTTREKLTLSFFPFHVPNYYFVGKGWRAYLYYNSTDKHAAIMALSVKTRLDFARALGWIANYVDMLGARYLELVISANLVDYHKIAFMMGYLPCAYFPAASSVKGGQEGKREDQVVFCYPLSFPRISRLKLTPEAYRFVRAYLENLLYKMRMEMETIDII